MSTSTFVPGLGFFSAEDLMGEDNTSDQDLDMSESVELDAAISKYQEGESATDNLENLGTTISNLPIEGENSFNASTAVVADLAIEHYCNILYLKNNKSSYKTGFENYSRLTNKEIRKLSLESISETITKGKEKLTNFLKGIVEKTKTIFNNIFNSKKKLQERLSKIKSNLSNAVEQVEIPANLAKDLTINSALNFGNISKSSDKLVSMLDFAFNNTVVKANEFLKFDEEQLKKAEKLSETDEKAALDMLNQIVSKSEKLQDLSYEWLKSSGFTSTERGVYVSKELFPGEKRIIVGTEEIDYNEERGEGANVLIPQTCHFSPINKNPGEPIKISKKDFNPAVACVEKILESLDQFKSFEQKLSEFSRNHEIIVTMVHSFLTGLKAGTMVSVYGAFIFYFILLAFGAPLLSTLVVIPTTIAVLLPAAFVGAATGGALGAALVGILEKTSNIRSRAYIAHGNRISRYLRVLTLFNSSIANSMSKQQLETGLSIVRVLEMATKTQQQAN